MSKLSNSIAIARSRAHASSSFTSLIGCLPELVFALLLESFASPGSSPLASEDESETTGFGKIPARFRGSAGSAEEFALRFDSGAADDEEELAEDDEDAAAGKESQIVQ